MRHHTALRKFALGAIFLLAALGIARPAAAGNEEEKKLAESHRAEIEAFYPQVINSINSGQYDQARELIRKAISWEPEDPLHYYNLACIEARAGNQTVALAALQNSVDLGFHDLDLIDKDPDLNSIRKDEAFRKMYQVIATNNLAAKEGGGPEVAEIYQLDKKDKDQDKAVEEAPAPAAAPAVPVQ